MKSACLALGMSRADVEASEFFELWDVARHGMADGRVMTPAEWGIRPPGGSLSEPLVRGGRRPAPGGGGSGL